jgi:transposase
MRNNNYSVDYKLQAVEMLKNSGKTQRDVAKELGVSDSTLSKWSRQYELGMFQKPSESKVASSSEREIQRLTAELKRKTMEVEILKKATAFFAKESV